MKTPIRWVLTLCLVTVSGWAVAEEPEGWSVQFVKTACQRYLRGDTSDPAFLRDSGVCYGTITGADAAMSVSCAIVKKYSDVSVKVGAPPEDMTIGAMAQIFVNWAEKHPEYWNQSAGIGYIHAMAEKFPCMPGAGN